MSEKLTLKPHTQYSKAKMETKTKRKGIQSQSNRLCFARDFCILIKWVCLARKAIVF